MDTAAEISEEQDQSLFDFLPQTDLGRNLKTTSALSVPSIDRSAAEMATGEENVSEELKKLMLDLKKAATKLQTILDCYNPRRYPGNVLRTNKDAWMKKIDDAMASVTESCLEIQFVDNATEACLDESKDFLKEANDRFTQFFIDLDIKILEELNLGDNRSESVASGGGQSNDSDRGHM